IPALILMTSFVGFGVLCRESGLTMSQAVFITAAVWALPNQVLLVGAITSGASILVTAIAVTLAGVRFMPMVAAWVPVIRGKRTPLWQLLVLSHFVAVTAWVFSLLRLPKMPARYRIPYFAGFACTLTTANLGITALSFEVAGALPPVLAGAAFFLTPIYFLTALTAAARIAAERWAMAIGVVLGPALFAAGVGLDLLWAGLLGGTLAYGIDRLTRRRT
ncbi:MAG TPA: AzlC family ABC transporter permease, partial [Afifellaceae bacterium]|nr:AzlC family ABC transporter permease [Afifellaceae bacterium]